MYIIHDPCMYRTRYEKNMCCFFLPTHSDVAELRVVRRRARFETRNVEVGQGVVDEAVHGPRLAKHVLVDQTRDEVRCEGNDKGLQ